MIITSSIYFCVQIGMGRRGDTWRMHSYCLTNFTKNNNSENRLRDVKKKNLIVFPYFFKRFPEYLVSTYWLSPRKSAEQQGQIMADAIPTYTYSTLRQWRSEGGKGGHHAPGATHKGAPNGPQNKKLLDNFYYNWFLENIF